jgi:hypothetical protein
MSTFSYQIWPVSLENNINKHTKKNIQLEIRTKQNGKIEKKKKKKQKQNNLFPWPSDFFCKPTNKNYKLMIW